MGTISFPLPPPLLKLKEGERTRTCGNHLARHFKCNNGNSSIVKVFVFLLLLSSVSSGNKNENNDRTLQRTSRRLDDSKPLRVFKYVTENEFKRNPNLLGSDRTSSSSSLWGQDENKTFQVKSESIPCTIFGPSSSCSKNNGDKKKDDNNKLMNIAIKQRDADGHATDPKEQEVLIKRRAGSVTDRSLIPNSFYNSNNNKKKKKDEEEEGVNKKLLKPNHNYTNTQPANLKSDLHLHHLGGKHSVFGMTKIMQTITPTSSTMHLPDHYNKGGEDNTRNHFHSYESKNNNGGVKNKVEVTLKPGTAVGNGKFGNSNSETLHLSFNATANFESSERPRRSSPYALSYGGYYGRGGGRPPAAIRPTYMPMMPQTNRNTKVNSGMMGHSKKAMLKRQGAGGSSSNRAALYIRNPNLVSGGGVSIPHHHHHHPKPLPFGGQFQLTAAIPVPFGMRPSRPSSGGGRVGGSPVIMALPNKSPQRVMVLDPIMPSSSTDTMIVAEESTPTWNHPMYKKYVKVARGRLNKFMGFNNNNNGRSGSSKPGSGVKDRDSFRPSFSKIPYRGGGGGPNGLMRYRGRDRDDIRDRDRRERGPPSQGGGGGRYKYPKSAHSIQDILEHFNRGEREHDHHHDGPPPSSGPPPSRESHSGSGSRYPSERGRDRDKERDEDRPPPAPMAIADLSSELNDVRFSLLRDIKQFAKRPSILAGEDSGGSGGSGDSERVHPYEASKRRKEKEREREGGKNRYYEDRDNWRNKKPPPPKPYLKDTDDPHSPHYDHESGFDEIFNPKPKPVRDMTNKVKSSRFRNKHDERESSSHSLLDNNNHDDDDDDHHYRQKIRKKDRPPPHPHPHSETDHPYNYPRKPSKFHQDDDHSTERPSDNKPGKFVSTEEEMAIDRHDGDDRDREIRKRHKYTGRDNKYPEDHHHHDSEDPYNNVRKNYVKRYRNRPPSSSYPKSIRDKLRDHHHQDQDSHSFEHSPAPGRKRPYNNHHQNQDDDHYSENLDLVNRPIVLKKPRGRITHPFASATEKSNMFGMDIKPTLPSNGYIPILRQSQYPSSSSAGFLPPGSQFPVAVTLPEPHHHHPHEDHDHDQDHDHHHEDDHGHDHVFEIHTGLRATPPPAVIGQLPSSMDAMQRAYMELLQHKMHSEASLVNSHLPVQIAPKPMSSKKSGSPMRMKIHIYPNNDPSPHGHLNNPHAPTPTQHFFHTNPSPAASSSSSHHFSRMNSVPVLSPRYPQKVAGTLNTHYHDQGTGGSSLYGGGGNGNTMNMMNMMSGGNKPTLSSSTDSKNNKNVVLHLHVHRRHDTGPVELEAEASDHSMISTEKPLNYHELYEDFEQPQSQPQPVDVMNHNHPSANNQQQQEESDKTVSLEVPLKDDKIEDVLNTLLQYRERQGDRSITRRRKRK